MSLPSRTHHPAQPAPAQPRFRRGRGRLLIWLAVGLIVTLVVVAVLQVGLQRQTRLAGTNGIYPAATVATIKPGRRLCQVARLPDGTRAVEIPFDGAPREGRMRLTVLAPNLSVAMRSAPDTRRLRWARFELPRTLDGTESAVFCLTLSGPGPGIGILGSVERGGGLSLAEKAIPGALSARYVRAGSESAFAMVPVVAERIGRIRGFGAGPVWAILIALAVISGVVLTALLLIGRLQRRAALFCALAAVLNAAAWALLTPVYQVPDETSHVSYVQDLAVKGTAPKPGDPPDLSPELVATIDASAVGAINFNSFARPIWDAEGERRITAPLDRGLSTRNPSSNANVVDYPPLYYATLIPAYAATHALGGTTLAAITPMRLVSALYAGVTVLALFALLSELFPRRRELVVPITLACAYLPILSWISGGVNPDGLLIAVGALMFWLFARGFRRGLEPSVAAGLGLTMVAAVLVQVRGLGLGPGWAVGVLLLLWLRTPPAERFGRAALVVGCALGPLVAYEFLNVLVWDRPLLPGGVTAAASATPAPADPNTGFLTFLWQYALPPFAGMTDFFNVRWTVKDLWVPMWVGKFGWYDYQFPDWLNLAALIGYAGVAVAALWALVPQLRRVRTVKLLTLVYALLAFGIVIAIARVAYPMRASGGFIFEQARYVLPLIGLYALALALACSLLRRRAGLVASIFVGGCVLHLLAALNLTIQRYYL